MKRTNYLVPIVVSCFLATGCVSKKQFAELQTSYRQLQTENSDLSKSYQQAQVTLAENRANIKSLEERLAEAQQNNADLKASYASLQGSLDKSIQQGNINISKLVDEINASNRFIKQLSLVFQKCFQAFLVIFIHIHIPPHLLSGILQKLSGRVDHRPGSRLVKFLSGPESPGYNDCFDAGIFSGLHIYFRIPHIETAVFVHLQRLHDVFYSGRIRFFFDPFLLPGHVIKDSFPEDLFYNLYRLGVRLIRQHCKLHLFPLQFF